MKIVSHAKTATELRLEIVKDLDVLVARLDVIRQSSSLRTKWAVKVAKAQYYEIYDYRERLRDLLVDGVRIEE